MNRNFTKIVLALGLAGILGSCSKEIKSVSYAPQSSENNIMMITPEMTESTEGILSSSESGLTENISENHSTKETFENYRPTEIEKNNVKSDLKNQKQTKLQKAIVKKMQKLSAQDEDEGKKYVRMGAVIWLLGVILVVVGAVISAGSITAGTATGLGAGGAISLIGSLIATLGFLIAVYGLLKWLDIL